jgi:hypothetical protein
LKKALVSPTPLFQTMASVGWTTWSEKRGRKKKKTNIPRLALGAALKETHCITFARRT